MCLLLYSKPTLIETHSGDFRVLRANIHKSTKSVRFNKFTDQTNVFSQ